MTQVLRVGSVRRLDIPQSQGLADFLHEVEQLVHFKQRHERFSQTDQVAMHKTKQRRPSRCHRWPLQLLTRDLGRVGAVRLEDQRVQVRNAGERPMDTGLTSTHSRPPSPHPSGGKAME